MKDETHSEAENAWCFAQHFLWNERASALHLLGSKVVGPRHALTYTRVACANWFSEEDNVVVVFARDEACVVAQR